MMGPAELESEPVLTLLDAPALVWAFGGGGGSGGGGDGDEHEPEFQLEP